MLRRLFLFSPVLLAQEPIRVQVNLVNVPFSVRDAKGNWVTDLTAEDVEVLEDGVRQKVSFFSRAGDSPLSIAVVADVSGSQEDFLKDHRRDLKDFLKTVMRPKDQAMLVCFGHTIRLVSKFDRQPDQLDDALKEYQKAKSLKPYPIIGPVEMRDNASPVYDAIVNTAREMANESGRKAMLVFSDGEDNASAANLMDAIETAQEAGITVFCLRYTEIKKGVWRARNKYGRSVMARIASESGGMDFDAGESDDLRNEFRQIADMLRSTYDLAYTSSFERDGSFRKIKIRTRRDGLTTRHKTGYYARTS